MLRRTVCHLEDSLVRQFVTVNSGEWNSCFSYSLIGDAQMSSSARIVELCLVAADPTVAETIESELVIPL